MIALGQGGQALAAKAFELHVVPGRETHALHWEPVEGAEGYTVWWSDEEDPEKTGMVVSETDALEFSHAFPESSPLSYYLVVAHRGHETLKSPIRAAGPFTFVPQSFYSPIVVGDFERDGQLGFVLGNAEGTGESPPPTEDEPDARGLDSAIPYPFFRARGGGGDFNGDGWTDFLTAPYAPPAGTQGEQRYGRLYFNDRKGAFEESKSFLELKIEGFSETPVAADFDNDGDLDIYIPVYPNKHPKKNWFLLNDGQGEFVNVAEEAGLAGQLWPLPEGAQAIDINRDGWLDIYVSSRFYVNQGVSEGGVPRFTEVLYGLERRFDEGAKLLDWNRDGEWDIVENHPSLGPVFYERSGAIFVRRELPELPAGDRQSSWGLNVCDINHDGWSDFFIPGGDLDGEPAAPLLFVNVRTGFVLSDVLQVNGLFQMSGGVADFDNNGGSDLAMLVAPRSGLAFESKVGILYNPVESSPPVRIELRDERGMANQQGREVMLWPPDGLPMMEAVDGGSGWLACNPYDLRFTVEDERALYRAEARFAAGVVTVEDIRAGEHLVIFPDGAVEAAGYAWATQEEEILEREEDGKALTIRLEGQRLRSAKSSPLRPARESASTLGESDVRIKGLPAGVSVGEIKRINEQEIQVKLSGNATEDYDTLVSLMRITVRKGCLENSERDLYVDSRVILHPANEAPTLLGEPTGEALATYPYRSAVGVIDDEDDALTLETLEAPEWLEVRLDDEEGLIFEGTPPGESVGEHVLRGEIRDEGGNVREWQWTLVVWPEPEILTYERWVEELVAAGSDPDLLAADLDPDFDEQSNLLEFALGGDPFVRDSLIDVIFDAGAVEVMLPYTRRFADVVVKLQHSPDLTPESWEEVEEVPEEEKTGLWRILRKWRVMAPNQGREYYRVLVETAR